MARARYYQRLTRNRSGIGTYTSLWLGPDHLLLAASTGFNETYRRFYFRDIKAFVVSDSPRFLIWLAITGSILLFLALGALIATAATGVSPWILVPLVPTLVLFAWNLLRGPSCNVRLVTGVQTIVMPPLSRFRQTRKVLARLAPLIEAAQSSLAAPASPAPPALPPEEPAGPLPVAEAPPAA